MNDLSHQVRDVFDPVEPISPDEVETVVRRRSVRRRKGLVGTAAATVGAAVVVTVVILTSSAPTKVVTGPVHGGPLTLTPFSSIFTPGVSSTLVLAQPSIPSGWTMSATVVVENHSGSPIHTSGCIDFFGVGLTNDQFPPVVGWLDCLQRFTIPIGRSEYPLSIRASKGGGFQCSPSPTNPCEPPPLPPGIYQATVFEQGNAIPLPDPVPVRVTPAASPANGVIVPNVSGMSVVEAKKALEEVGLAMTEKALESGSPGGPVRFQTPDAGSTVLRGSTVTVYVQS